MKHTPYYLYQIQLQDSLVQNHLIVDMTQIYYKQSSTPNDKVNNSDFKQTFQLQTFCASFVVNNIVCKYHSATKLAHDVNASNVKYEFSAKYLLKSLQNTFMLSLYFLAVPHHLSFFVSYLYLECYNRSHAFCVFTFWLSCKIIKLLSSLSITIQIFEKSNVFLQLLIKILDENIFSDIKNVISTISTLYNVKATIGKGDDDNI